jgi:hypothetical protein
MPMIPISPRPLLDLKVYPRHNLYLGNDEWAGFVVDASLSYTHGQAYCPILGDADVDAQAGVLLDLVIFRTDTGQTVVERVEIPVNQTGIEARFRLTDFAPRTEPYDIIIRTITPKCGRSYQSTTQLNILPPRADGGSVARLDNKFKTISLGSNTPEGLAVWRPMFVYSFYVSWSDFLLNNITNLEHYGLMGYNVIHPVPGYGKNPWTDFAAMDKFLDETERLGLHVMYDMRWTYRNQTMVKEQVSRYKNKKSILVWYTADEPDGYGDPPEQVVEAYETIRSLDPYKPVALVLNCQNYRYKDYQAGADIIMTDPYPVGINPSFSQRHQTPCNANFGDCGCDNCNGLLSDVSTRMDIFKRHQDSLDTPPKTFWGVPQAFGGQDYWSRTPTASEEIVMTMLFVNHGANGVVAWEYPAVNELMTATSDLSKVLSGEEVGDFLTGSKSQHLTLGTAGQFDAVVWRLGKQLLFSVVHLTNTTYPRDMRLGLGVNATAMKMLWPATADNWYTGDKSITRPGMGPFEVNLFIVQTS